MAEVSFLGFGDSESKKGGGFSLPDFFNDHKGKIIIGGIGIFAVLFLFNRRKANDPPDEMIVYPEERPTNDVQTQAAMQNFESIMMGQVDQSLNTAFSEMDMMFAEMEATQAEQTAEWEASREALRNDLTSRYEQELAAIREDMEQLEADPEPTPAPDPEPEPEPTRNRSSSRSTNSGSSNRSTSSGSSSTRDDPTDYPGYGKGETPTNEGAGSTPTADPWDRYLSSELGVTKDASEVNRKRAWRRKKRAGELPDQRL